MKKLLLILLLIIPFVGFGQINTTTTKYVIPEDKSLGNSWYRFTVEEKTKDNEKYYYVTFHCIYSYHLMMYHLSVNSHLANVNC